MTEKRSLFSRLRDGLFKSREHMSMAMEAAVQDDRPIDEDLYDDLMDALILSDMGASCAGEAIERLRGRVKQDKLRYAPEAKEALKHILVEMLEVEKPALHWPMIILMVGVNGVGKTTTIGKLALRFQGLGRTIILCAADTFRAAAAEQLSVWAERAGVPIIKHGEGADPAAVVFDAIASFKAKGCDLLLCDTAGRLHNKKNLMSELEKIRRVIARELPGVHTEVLLVLDATTGQNAIAQARVFGESAGLTGVVLTKLDGTAKGGMTVAIKQELGLPVRFVGVGEGIDDLQPFDADAFARALIGA